MTTFKTQGIKAGLAILLIAAAIFLMMRSLASRQEDRTDSLRQMQADAIETGKADWGHCTVDYAVEVALQANARSLVLFHHDPGHDDDEVDRMSAEAAERGRAGGLDEVIAAAEGMKLTVSPRL